MQQPINNSPVVIFGIVALVFILVSGMIGVLLFRPDAASTPLVSQIFLTVAGVTVSLGALVHASSANSNSGQALNYAKDASAKSSLLLNGSGHDKIKVAVTDALRDYDMTKLATQGSGLPIVPSASDAAKIITSKDSGA